VTTRLLPRGAVTVALAGFALLPVPFGTGQAGAAPCPDVEVTFARATTEPPGVGDVGQGFVDSLRSQVPGRSVGVYAVNYPATDDFVSSASIGATDANSHIRSMATSCPDTRMVLAGYSQGALVVDLLTAVPIPIAGFEPAPLPPEAADRIAAIAVFGNPLDRYLGAPLTAVSPQYGAKAIDLCQAGDPICTPRPGDTSVPPRDELFAPAHLGYLKSGLVNQGAAFAAGRVQQAQ
jgi:cutinase